MSDTSTPFDLPDDDPTPMMSMSGESYAADMRAAASNAGATVNDPGTVRLLVLFVSVVTVLAVMSIVILTITDRAAEAVVVGLMNLSSMGLGGLISQMTTRVSAPSAAGAPVEGS